MYLDIQKANMWKRISAALFDVIILSVVVALLAMILSGVLGFDRYNSAMDDCYSKYEAMYGISFDITMDDYNAMTQEQLSLYDEAYKAFSVDPDAIYNFNMIVRLTLTIASISILLGYLIMEFTIPLFLGNGRTLGKRIFGIGVMRTHSIRVTPIVMFIRTVLGKFAVETMVSVLIILMIFWGTIGIIGPLVIAGILILQVILLATSSTRSVIHDRLSDTVVVDMESQRIFENEDELIEYTKRLHAEKAANQVY